MVDLYLLYFKIIWKPDTRQGQLNSSWAKVTEVKYVNSALNLQNQSETNTFHIIVVRSHYDF